MGFHAVSKQNIDVGLHVKFVSYDDIFVKNN